MRTMTTPAIVAVGSLLVAIATLLFNERDRRRNRRRVIETSYEEDSDFSAALAPWEGLTTVFEGQPISKLRMVRARFVNVGSVALKPEEIDSPANVRVPDGTVISAKIMLADSPAATAEVLDAELRPDQTVRAPK